MSRSEKTNVLNGSIPGHVFRMLVPFSIAVIALISTGIVDAIYLARLTSDDVANLGTLAIAALGVASPITFFGNSANIGLGAGTMSAVSRALGQGDEDKAARHGAAAILMALLVMTLLAGLMYLALPHVLNAVGAEDDVRDMAQNYLMLSIPGLVIVSVAMMSNNILRAGGEALLPSAIMILGAVINIVLDPFLIFGWGPFPRLEVTGAALATVIGNTIAACVGLYIVWFHRKVIHFTGITLNSIKHAWTVVGKVGVPAAITNTVVPLATIVAVAIVTRNLSVESLAAFTIALRAELLSVGLLYGLSACIGAITGRNGGAGETGRVRDAFKTCYLICFGWSTIMAVVMAVFAGPMTAIFTQDPVVADQAIQYFYIVPVTIFAYGFVFLSAAGFNALGRPLYGLSFTIIRSLVLYIGFIYIGVMVDGLRGAFFGLAGANLLSGIVAGGWTFLKAPMTARKS